MPIFNEVVAQLSAQLRQLYDLALPTVEQVSHLGQGVAGLLAFVYIGYQLWGKWSRGESIDFYAMLKPFAIGLLILFFGVFTSFLQVLVSPIEAATASLNTAIYEEYTQQQQAYAQCQVQLRNAKAVYERGHVEQEAEVVELSVSQEVSSEEEEEMKTYGKWVDAWAKLSQIAVVGIVLYFQIFITAAQLILLLVGPFAFAFALFPGFERNIHHWMAHYVQLLLYGPLCSFIGFMVALLFTHVLYQPFVEMLQNAVPLAEDWAAYQEVGQMQQLMQGTIGLFYTLAFVLYTRIPQFSRWLIHSFQP